MMDAVDEAVAKSLHGLLEHKTGNKQTDEFVEQSIITLGGMVKIAAMIQKMDTAPINKFAMGMTLESYKRLIDSIMHDITGGHA